MLAAAIERTRPQPVALRVRAAQSKAQLVAWFCFAFAFVALLLDGPAWSLPLYTMSGAEKGLRERSVLGGMQAPFPPAVAHGPLLSALAAAIA